MICLCTTCVSTTLLPSQVIFMMYVVTKGYHIEYVLHRLIADGGLLIVPQSLRRL